METFCVHRTRTNLPSNNLLILLLQDDFHQLSKKLILSFLTLGATLVTSVTKSWIISNCKAQQALFFKLTTCFLVPIATPTCRENGEFKKLKDIVTMIIDFICKQCTTWHLCWHCKTTVKSARGLSCGAAGNYLGKVSLAWFSLSSQVVTPMLVVWSIMVAVVATDKKTKQNSVLIIITYEQAAENTSAINVVYCNSEDSR